MSKKIIGYIFEEEEKVTRYSNVYPLWIGVLFWLFLVDVVIFGAIDFVTHISPLKPTSLLLSITQYVFVYGPPLILLLAIPYYFIILRRFVPWVYRGIVWFGMGTLADMDDVVGYRRGGEGFFLHLLKSIAFLIVSVIRQMMQWLTLIGFSSAYFWFGTVLVVEYVVPFWKSFLLWILGVIF
jgi:hypothetical protein